MEASDLCGICRDDEIVEPTKIVECGHVFCFSCIGKWCNVSNSCPLCQRRFLKLCRIDRVNKNPRNQTTMTKVKPVDRREESWMQVMEEYDSEECSIHTEDDHSGSDDDEELGSEGDRYESDFVVPDDVVIYASGKIVRLADAGRNPFGKPPRGQPDSVIVTQDGQKITISWNDKEQSTNNSDNDQRYMSDDDDGDEDYIQETSEDSDQDDEECPEPVSTGRRPAVRGKVLYQPPPPTVSRK